MFRAGTLRMNWGSSNRWNNQGVPDGFPWSPPFRIQRREEEYRVDPMFSLVNYANVSPGVIYYVDRSRPNDLGDGLSWSTAFQKISTAVTKAQDCLINVMAGTYELGYTWGLVSPTRNMIVRSYGGPAIISAHRAGLVWNASGNHYWATHATKIWNVWDRSILDANGDFTMLTRKATEAEVDGEAGSWWYDDPNDKLFVRTTDGRAPDADILPMEQQSYCGYFAAAKTVYMEGLEFHGAAIPFGTNLASALMKVYAYRCSFKYSYNTMGFSMSGGGESILQECIAARNIGLDATATDGFKATESGGQYCNMALIDCIGRHNGRATHTSDNGYSRHDRGNTIVLKGEYYGNFGRNIHDVNANNGNPNLWCINVYAHHSAAAAGANKCDLGMGVAATPGGEGWFEACQTVGSSFDIDAGPGTTIRLRKHSPATPVTEGTGTIEDY